MNALTILALPTEFVKMASIVTHAVAQMVSEVVIVRRILTTAIPTHANIMVIAQTESMTIHAVAFRVGWVRTALQIVTNALDSRAGIMARVMTALTTTIVHVKRDSQAKTVISTLTTVNLDRANITVIVWMVSILLAAFAKLVILVHYVKWILMNVKTTYVNMVGVRMESINITAHVQLVTKGVIATSKSMNVPAHLA